MTPSMIGRDRWRAVAADVRTCRLRAGSGVTGQLGTHCLLVRQSSTLSHAHRNTVYTYSYSTLHYAGVRALVTTFFRTADVYLLHRS